MNAKTKRAWAVTVIGLAILALGAIGIAQRQPLHSVVAFEAFSTRSNRPPGNLVPSPQTTPTGMVW
jgi:hypothetical protein